MTVAVWLAPVLTALASGLLAAQIVPPRRRLATRIRPYTLGARTSLGRPVDPRSIGSAMSASGGGPLAGVLRSFAATIAARVGRLLDDGAEQAIQLRLRQAGLLRDVPEDRRVLEYRTRQLLAGMGWAAGGVVGGLALGLGATAVVALLVGGAVAGISRVRGQIDRALEERRDRMRIELYTINQLLAMNVRVGGGVVQAVTRVVERGRGAVVAELREILGIHASGLSARDAFLRAAAETPDPSVARTYRLLAAGSEYGADLADALLEHSEDVREARREALRRAATKRRAATLIPIIGILAPVMLLFVAAPLPSIVFRIG